MPKYFVSYAFSTKYGARGFGSSDVEVAKPILGKSDTEMIADSIKETRDAKDISIISWRRYEQPSIPCRMEDIIKALYTNARSSEVIGNDQGSGYRACIEDLERLLAKRVGNG